MLDALLDAQRRFGGKVAVADARLQLTYKRLAALAAVMRDVVIAETPAPRIGILLPASAIFPAALFGTWWAGRVPVPLNFLLAPNELAAIASDAGLDLILSVGPLAKMVGPLPVRTLLLDELPLKRKMLLGMLRRAPDPPAMQPSDTAVLLYTSGTSGLPKGVELSVGNLRTNCEASIAAAGLDATHRLLNVLPPFHVFGLTANVLMPIVLGASVYAIARFNPRAAVRAVQEQGLSTMMAIPSMYAAMMRTKGFPEDALKTLQLAESGGEPLPEAVEKGFMERFGVQLVQGYGLTETSPVVSLSSMANWRPGSVGRPIPGVHVRVIDDENNPLPTGQAGEICVRGPNVMKGYYRQPEQTDLVIDSEGWFRTGDVGSLDADGYLYISARIKDLIIVGGENVYPREVEAVLERHPAVAEAAVVGVEDTSRGQVPVAFVGLVDGAEATEAELRTFARQRLAGYKTPRRVHIVDQLPRSPTGKVLKRALMDGQ